MKILVYVVLLCAVVGLVSCGGAEEERLTCHDILSEEASGFAEVSGLLMRYCGGCHNASSLVYGYDFGTPESVYSSVIYKPDIVYAQMATGLMPPDGPKLEDEQLRVFRSWYCRGALYESEDP
ncbi:MAG: hypothetical protein VX699_06285 [Myxococcota bacterium]|nr:hypothetical protein [Myxococcota bacterium]